MNKRKKYSPQQKLEIVLTGLSSPDGVSKVCRQYGISTVQFYQWKDRLIKSAPDIYARKSRKSEGEKEKLKETIAYKDGVIAHITEENIKLKKNLGM